MLKILKRWLIMNPYVRIVWVALIMLAIGRLLVSGSDLPVLSSKPDVSSYHLGPEIGSKSRCSAPMSWPVNTQFKTTERLGC
jgi:hypothetical protein